MTNHLKLPLEQQCCANCRNSREGGDNTIRCHARAPMTQLLANWPLVRIDDWCGEWCSP